MVGGKVSEAHLVHEDLTKSFDSLNNTLIRVYLHNKCITPGTGMW